MPTDSISRRTFLERIAAATGILVAGRREKQHPGNRPAPHIVFPSAPRERIAVASYPFRAYIESPNNSARDRSLPGTDLLDFFSEVKSRFNINNVEPHYRHFRSLDAEYLGTVRKTASKLGMKIVDIAVGAEQSFYDADDSARNKAIAFANKWVDVAVAVGSPNMRVHVEAASNSKPDVERAAASLHEVVSYAAAKNVVVNLENDDLVSEDAFFLVQVIEAVNHPFLRALPDFANSMLTGNADFNYRAVAAMFQHAYSICHIKDGEADDHGRQFNIDLKKSFSILKASGFRGYCSMEFDAPGDPYAATSKLVEKTLQYLS